MLSKLPDELRLIILRKFPKDVWNIDLLLQEFGVELEARERVILQTSTVSNKYQTVKPKPPTAAALFSSQDRRSSPTCSFCRKRHLSASCTIVTDVAARKYILKKQGRCFWCLKRNHVARDCSLQIKCSSCGMKHHVAICSKRNNFEVPEIRNNEQQTQMEQPETLKESASSTVAPATTPATTATAPSDVKPDEREGATLYINARTQIFLQTARALASNPNTPHEIENVRVLFDSGSSRTYITSDLKEKL